MRGRQRTRLVGAIRVAAVLVALSMSTVGWLGAVQAGAATSPKCSKVFAIGVRGSGETSTSAGGLGVTVSVAIKRFRQLIGAGVDVQPINYPSLGFQVALSNPSSYYAGAKVGINVLTQTLQRQAGSCPHEPIVLFGYSQGAMVANRALVALGTAQPAILNRIAAVELIADPQRLGSAPYVWGSASHQLNGLGVYVTSLKLPGVGFPSGDLPHQLQARSRSSCVSGDLVCAYDTTKPTSETLSKASLAAAGRAHDSYATNGYARNAGTHAAQTLKHFKATPT